MDMVMTVEELVALTESLLGDQTVESIRSGKSQPKVDDEQFVLLVRFLAGERPEVGGSGWTPTGSRQGGYEPVSIPDHLEHEDEVGPQPQGGPVRNMGDLEEFQGIALL